MDSADVLLLSLLILLAAALYSSVGHGGASGYLAAMALFGLAPAVMRPTALCLNLLVSSLGTLRFWRAGHFRWRAFWPFAATSIPAAYVGGAITLPTSLYKQLVGLALLFAAVRLFLHARKLTGADDPSARPTAADGQAPKYADEEANVRDAPLWLGMLLGVLIGLLSGLTGVGGGIFLSPLLLLAGWAGARQTAAVSAAFIFVNSAAGLLGNAAGVKSVSAALPYFAVAALAGGLAGTEFGSRRLPPLWVRRLLAAVLVVAGLKLIFA
ncbi:MAG TPA: sulfite exporter TauE/SafE family protein [Pyrinomonadaceae bacterium]|nr:sulfite exporter TauE/SafE family protein [Pyrinomonadaceae bacterium]